MLILLKRAFKDIALNRFQHAFAIITIAFSILIVSAFSLFMTNLNAIMNSWKEGIRIMVYLKSNVEKNKILEIERNLLGMYGVKDTLFISKEEGLTRLKEQMKRQSSLLENLTENPLPDAFEISMISQNVTISDIENLAGQIESMPEVSDVEYGKKWIGRFVGFLKLFQMVGIALGGIFFIAAVVIAANTIRLVLYSRRDEIEIMRLVGASDGFIKAPFYIEGILHGAFGGFIGLLCLSGIYLAIENSIENDFTTAIISLRFLSIEMMLIIFFVSVFAGWMGCFLSLRQFLKK